MEELGEWVIVGLRNEISVCNFELRNLNSLNFNLKPETLNFEPVTCNLKL
jgi:hypothetical protein